jgi:flagellar biogenesis protein FliO
MIDRFRGTLSKMSKHPRSQWAMIGLLILVPLVVIILSLRVGASPAESNTLIQTQPTLFESGVDIIIKLALVLVLVFVSLYGLRFLKLGGGVSGKKLKVIETTRLSSKQTLHLIDVGGNVYLVGATDQSVRLLTPIDTPMPEESPQAGTFGSSSSGPFHRILSASIQQFPDAQTSSEKNPSEGAENLQANVK